MIRGRIRTDSAKTVNEAEDKSRNRKKNTKAVATGRAANGFGEVREVDTGTVGGDGRGSAPKKGETSCKALEDKSADVSPEEAEKPQSH